MTCFPGRTTSNPSALPCHMGSQPLRQRCTCPQSAALLRHKSPEPSGRAALSPRAPRGLLSVGLLQRRRDNLCLRRAHPETLEGILAGAQCSSPGWLAFTVALPAPRKGQNCQLIARPPSTENSTGKPLEAVATSATVEVVIWSGMGNQSSAQPSSPAIEFVICHCAPAVVAPATVNHNQQADNGIICHTTFWSILLALFFHLSDQIIY